MEDTIDITKQTTDIPASLENDNKYIKLENKEPYQVLLITPNSIESRDWSASNYTTSLLSDTFCQYTMIDPKDYVYKISELLSVGSYIYCDVKVCIISEETDYIDEIMYIDLLPEFKTNENKNDFATLLNLNGDIIHGNAIVSRTKISSTVDLYNTTNKSVPMFYIDVNIENLDKMMHQRAHTKLITYDSDNETYNEIEVFGPLDHFAEIFFGEAQYNYKKIELGFLKHNINIWYSENKYGNLDVFGNILPELSRVDKMIVFTMWTENYRGNLLLDEFTKIKFLSKKLNNYDVPVEFTEESLDDINRVIVKNKYRILNTIYNKYKN